MRKSWRKFRTDTILIILLSFKILLVESSTPLSSPSGINSIGDRIFEIDTDLERHRLKEQIAQGMADYLYNYIEKLKQQDSQQQQQQQQLESTRINPLLPGQALDYSNFLTRDDPQLAAEAARNYIKKSLSGTNNNKHIRFHQCYFNPISCF